MTQAADAVLLDTSEMTIEQAFDAARRIVEDGARPLGKLYRANPPPASPPLEEHRGLADQPTITRNPENRHSSGAHDRASLNTRLNISMADDMSFNPTRDDFEALLNDSMGGRDFAEGTVVKGIVVGIEKDFAIIDVGLKTEGRVS
jgi:hypothetical protein